MAFSIPAPITPRFALPGLDEQPTGIYVGVGVRDLPSGAETTMKRANDARVIQVREEHRIATDGYVQDLARKQGIAQDASTKIGEARKKQIHAITALAVTIIGVIGAIAATWITGTLPLLFVAAPFAIALIPASYYTHIFSKTVSQLDADIAAPGLLKRPVLSLPQYRPETDLELKTSRLNVVAKLAINPTLKGLIESHLPSDVITNYDLLDRVTTIDPAKKPQVYAKTMQLMTLYTNTVTQYHAYSNQAESENAHLQQELKDWKEKQQGIIDNQERQLEALIREQQDPNKLEKSTGGKIFTSLSNELQRQQIESQKASLVQDCLNRKQQISAWLRDTNLAIQTAYQEAIGQLETKFTAVKAAAH